MGGPVSREEANELLMVVDTFNDHHLWYETETGVNTDANLCPHLK